MATVGYGSLPFQQQIAFFRNKENVLTESWTDLWESEHDNGFMVAGANRMELLTDLRDAIRRAIDDGETLSQFRARFDAIVARHGWDYNGGRNWRSRVIYETNLRQSYNAGRWSQLQRLKKSRPWWRYRHSDAVEHPRPQHQAWDGLILHCDDPWWLTHFPANGWGCQCYVEALSDDDLKRLGLKPGKAPPVEYVDALVGQRSASGPRLVRTPAGIDPGFGYAPGSSLDTWPAPRRGGPVTPPSMQRSLERTAQDALRKSTQLPASTAAEVLGELFALERAQQALQAGYAEFQAIASASSPPGNPGYFTGMFGGELLQAMSARGITPPTAAIITRAIDVPRLVSGAAAGMTSLPELLRAPRAVLWDPSAAELLYVGVVDSRLLAVRVAVGSAVPEVRSAALVDAAALADYTLLQGSLD